MISAVKKRFFLLAFAAAISSCKSEVNLSGFTMGTTWSVRAVTSANSNNLRQDIQQELERIEDTFSNWRQNSEISRFNSHNSASPFPVSRDMYVVMNVSLQVANDSNGAFNPALAGLIETSGFGVQDKVDKRAPVISSLQKHSDWRKLRTSEKDGKYYLTKTDPEIRLNLGAVAKGYGVDAIYLLLMTKGIHDFMVEIGGEVRTAGFNKHDEPWKIGIEWPTPDKNGIYKVIKLSDMAVATSGGYRNFKTEGKENSIHILDPATGQSVRNDLVSVSIIMPNCTYADALATAVTVTGKERGLELLKKYKYTDALLLYKEGEKIREVSTAGFKNYLQDTP